MTVTTQVLPWSADQLWPERIGATRSENYLDCMRSMYWFTVLGVPALSVPAGFTQDGLPVGVQIVGRSGDDIGVLRLARQIERALGAGLRRPPVAVPFVAVVAVPASPAEAAGTPDVEGDDATASSPPVQQMTAQLVLSQHHGTVRDLRVRERLP